MEKVLFSFCVRNGVAVHSFARRWIEVESGKAGQLESPSILGWNCIDPNPKERMWKRLVQLYDFWAHANNFDQVICITDARKTSLLPIRIQARVVVFPLFVKPLEILLGLVRQRSGRQEFLPGFGSGIGIFPRFAAPGRRRVHHQSIGSEGFFVEEDGWLQTARAVD